MRPGGGKYFPVRPGQLSYNVLVKMRGVNPIRQQKSFTAAPVNSREWLPPLAVSILAVALAASVFAIYGPALNFQFVLDDHRFVGDPRLQSAGHVWEYFTNYVWAQVPGGPPSFYRPLFVLWLRVNYILSGMSPWGWHLFSVMKHVAAAILLGLLVWELLRDRLAALIAATLFALHPAQTESVAWVTVPDPLMSAGVLGALLLYVKYTERRSDEIRFNAEKSRRKSRKQKQDNSTGWHSKAWLIASAATFLAALLAKETVIVLPAVIFILAVAFNVPSGQPEQGKPVAWRRADYRRRLIFAFGETLPFLVATVVYLFCRSNALGRWLVPATQHLPQSTVLLSWPAILWFYVKVLLWPVRSRAFADPNLADTFSLHGVFLPGLGVLCALAILVAACIWGWRRAQHELPERQAAGVKRALVIGACLLVLPILLTLNLNALNPGDFLHGRYTYLSLAGLMILLATGWHLSGRRRTVLLVASGVAAVVFSVLTVQQERAWKDDLTIFTLAHQNAPRNAPVAQNLARAHVQVGLGLDEAGHCDQAVPIFEQAIQQYPQDWFAWAGLGECRFKLNDLAGAEQSLRRAFELSHEARVKEEWQGVRAKMGLPSEPVE